MSIPKLRRIYAHQKCYGVNSRPHQQQQQVIRGRWDSFRNVTAGCINRVARTLSLGRLSPRSNRCQQSTFPPSRSYTIARIIYTESKGDNGECKDQQEMMEWSSEEEEEGEVKDSLGSLAESLPITSGFASEVIQAVDDLFNS